MKTIKTRGWVVEDADGSVWLFWNGREPIKDPIEKEWVSNGSNNISMVDRNELPDGVDPKWEDDRAIEVMTTTTTVISKLEII